MEVKNAAMASDTNDDTLTTQTVAPNDGNDDEEEEFLIMADIGHEIDQQMVIEHAVNSEIRAIDLDGSNPFLQIGPYTFQGHYDYVLGTNLFFSTASSTTNADDTASTSTPIEEPTANNNGNDLRLIGTGDKKLNLSRVYIYPTKSDIEENKSKS